MPEIEARVQVVLQRRAEQETGRPTAKHPSHNVTCGHLQTTVHILQQHKQKKGRIPKLRECFLTVGSSGEEGHECEGEKYEKEIMKENLSSIEKQENGKDVRRALH